jgi:hypothetical protein
VLVRLASFLLLIAPPIALAADAPSGGRITVVAPPAKAAAAVTPAPAPRSPLPAATAPAPQDAASCRMDCAQSYYLCHAGDQADQCGGPWSQCVATCNSPNLAPPAAASP